MRVIFWGVPGYERQYCEPRSMNFDKTYVGAISWRWEKFQMSHHFHKTNGHLHIWHNTARVSSNLCIFFSSVTQIGKVAAKIYGKRSHDLCKSI